MLSNKQNRCLPLAYKSFKARRVTHSVMDAETIALSQAFDMGYVLRKELQCLLPKQAIPLVVLTYSQTLFHSISKGVSTSEKRLMIDVAAARG